MKFATFENGAGCRLGVVEPVGGVIHDLTTRLGDGFGLVDLIQGWARLDGGLDRDVSSLPSLSLGEVSLCAPITPRRNLFCVGKNYSDHSAEFDRSGYDASDHQSSGPHRPVVFSKATTSVTGPRSVIDPHPGVTDELDYEAELAVVIGPGGRGIERGQAFEHVWGYTILNDVTARDVQRDHKQWLLGKSLDTHGPMGPWVVTADEVPDVQSLVVESWVNGEQRQKASVADLIFDIPTLIEVISAGITLLPGDVIATGTPAGVGIGFSPPRFLRHGDVVEVSITGLGALRNRIA